MSVQAWRRSPTRRIALASRIEDGVPPVVVDLDRMVNPVNLPERAEGSLPGQVTLAVRRAGDRFAAFSVTDCGPGIPPEIELLFQKFQQLDGACRRPAAPASASPS